MIVRLLCNKIAKLFFYEVMFCQSICEAKRLIFFFEKMNSCREFYKIKIIKKKQNVPYKKPRIGKTYLTGV